VTAVPLFLLDEDETEAAELDAYIGRSLINATGGTAVDADVIASDLLRRMGEHQSRVATLAEAKAREIADATARISHAYDSQIARHQQSALQYENAVQSIAQSIDWSAEKKKSRKVGYGTYGCKTEPERVKIIDQGKAIGYARAYFASAVKEKIVVMVEHKAIAPVVLARLHASGELPDGFEHTAESIQYYAKPDVE
jgi:hypothetical protein